MSWKSVELQVALPRTQDVGKMQEQMQQRGQVLQESLAQSQSVAEELKRKKVNEFEQKDKVHLKNQSQTFAKQEEGELKAATEEQSINIDHPYLGRSIDFNG
ncbi:hypothetical protein KO561_09000 [Radiobacillus kanasensis]|uniref:hypothetical protein n=1 Tax=Radiobacillus kanasensis TaxID=2844358 RepID=UPI001E2F00D7|nr:hypothetical protein [Radiobacillus kanasensis]UFU01051.1 hypothetical protein KO561_09000 [Radiobacillus kanasensis]